VTRLETIDRLENDANTALGAALGPLRRVIELAYESGAADSERIAELEAALRETARHCGAAGCEVETRGREGTTGCRYADDALKIGGLPTEDMNMKCRSCGAPIEWAKTREGKSMPLDAGEFEDGNLVLLAGVVREWREGDVLPCRRSHFASCKQASMWRRKK
jgi:hypothetical protein